ncbi:MAG: hypothetical protein E7351_00640 [Clostridiales bacterium]|nr:hypothetical protein [Clostridiales bacterium]
MDKQEKHIVQALDITTAETTGDTAAEISWSNISLMSETGTSITILGSDKYFVDYTENMTAISGGTKITFSSTNFDKINFDTRDDTTLDGTAGIITTTMKSGYQHTGYKLGYADTNDDGTKEYTYLYEVELVDGKLGVYKLANNIRGENLNTDEESAFSLTPEDLDPDYTGTLAMCATWAYIEYGLDMYYETSSLDDTLKSTSHTFSIGDYTAITETPDNDKSFGGWYIDKTKLTNSELSFDNEQINIDADEDLEDVTLLNFTQKDTNESIIGEMSFIVQDGATSSDSVYFITHMKGWGTLTQSQTNPVVRAMWSTAYDLQMSRHSDATNRRDKELNGIKASNDTDILVDTATFTIQYTSTGTYDYPFTYNIGKAFYKSSDFGSENNTYNYAKGSNNFYYIYYYGYEIKSWTIWFADNSGKNYYMYLNGDTFDINNTSRSISNDSGLLNFDMGDLAQFVDQYTFINGITTDCIFMIPDWTPVKIKLQLENGNYTNEFKYDNDYVISNTYTPTKTGKTFFSFKTNAGKHIAQSAKWSYTTFAHNEFTNKGIDPNNHNVSTYSLTVERIYLDNIYRINLDMGDGGGINTLVANNYTATGDVGSYSNNYYTCTLSFGAYDYISWYDFDGTGDEYLTEMKEIYDGYTEGIDYDGTNDFGMLNKLFTDVDGKHYIYLVNGERYSNLPVFLKSGSDLIFWINDTANTVSGKQYIYTTSQYNDGDHAQEIDTQRYTKSTTWSLADGGTAGALSWTAYYYKKGYALNISTLFEGSAGRYGYATVTMTNPSDDSVLEKYVVIYDVLNKKMQAYKYSTADLTKTTIKDFDLTNPVNVYIYVDADTTITIYDQSQDSDAMASGKFDSMIGYQYLDISISTNVSDIFDGSGYSYTILGTDLESKKLDSDETVDIELSYEYIDYDMTVQLNNGNAGSFVVQFATGKSGTMTKYTIQDMNIGQYYSIQYNAAVGFELQDDAFKFNDIVLQKYSDKPIQNYTWGRTSNQFNGTWLRENFYSQCGNNYSLDNIDLGTLMINTQDYVFKYGVKVYDSTVSANNGFIDEYVYMTEDEKIAYIDNLKKENTSITDEEIKEVEDSIITYVFELSEDDTTHLPTNKGSLRAVINELAGVSTDYNFYTYISKNDVLNDAGDIIRAKDTRYAILNSRLYFLYDPLTKKDNFYTTYDFILTDTTKISREIEVNTGKLSYMVDYTSGEIVPEENRIIYTLLEVRLLYTVDVSAEYVGVNIDDDGKYIDDPTGDKKITLNGANNNALTMIYNTTYESYSEWTGKYYTYMGLNNTLTCTHDALRYNTSQVLYSVIPSTADGVEDTLNALEVIDTTFTINEDTTLYSLVVTYNPQPLKATVVYQINGEAATASEINNYLSDFAFGIQGVTRRITDTCYIGDVLALSYTDIADDQYDIMVNINGVAQASTSVQGSKYLYNYEIFTQDYDNAGIEIVVNAQQMNGDEFIIAGFMLADSSQKTGNEDFTTDFSYKIKVNDNEQPNGSRILDGAKVTVSDVTVATGYTHVGYKKYGATTYTQGDLEINAFDSANHGGRYWLVVTKNIDINASLYTSNTSGKYNLNVGLNTGTELSGLYIGQTITLTADNDPTDNERLDHFYLTSDVDKNPITQVIITSELLENIGYNETPVNKTIDFGVYVKKIYKLDYTIDGTQYADVSIKVGKDNYTSGTYVDNATEISINVTPESVGNYNVYLNGALQDAGKIDTTLSITKDTEYVIKITPKSYAVIVNEGRYQTLTQLEANAPQEVESGKINNARLNNSTNLSQSYGSKATLTAMRKRSKTAELATITIVSQGKTIVISLNGEDITAITVDGVVVADLSATGFGLAISTNHISITYTTQADMTITLDYKAYKTINTK